MSALYLGSVKPTFFDNNGNPLTSGKVYTYYSDSSTELATYSDQAATVLNTNPIILDSRGQCDLYLQEQQVYKIVVTDADDVVQEQRDFIFGNGASGFGAGNINVVDYGAIPNVGTDQSAAFQAAIDAAHETKSCVYIPGGTWKINNTLVQPTQVPNGDTHYFMGFIADNPQGCILDFTDLASGNAIDILNVPTGSKYLNYQVIGPGKAVGTHTGMNFTGDPAGDVDHTGVYNVRFQDVWVTDFSEHAFYWEVPYVTVMDHLYCKNIGGVGFYIATGDDGVYVGGTSLTFTSTYANNCAVGYRVEPLVYSSLNATACDNCIIGYEFNGCSGMTVNGLGFEYATTANAASDIIAVKFRGVTGAPTVEGASFAINSCSISCATNTLGSFTAMDINRTIDLIVTAGHFYYNMGDKTPVREIVLGANTSNCIFQNCSGYSEYDSYSGAWRKTDAGTNNAIQNGAGGVPYSDMPAMTISGVDAYGTSLTVTGGSIVLSKATYAAIALYGSEQDYPKLEIANDGVLSFGDGTIAQDVSLVRSGVNSLLVTNFIDSGNLSTVGALDAGTSLTVGTTATITGQLLIKAGTSGSPGLSFSGEIALDTGLYSPGDGVLNITTNGVISANFTQSNANFPVGITVGGGNEFQAMYTGVIASTGTALLGPFTVTKGGTGLYTINHNLGTTNYTVMLTAINGGGTTTPTSNIQPGTRGLNTVTVYFSDSNTAHIGVDVEFDYIIIKL